MTELGQLESSKCLAAWSDQCAFDACFVIHQQWAEELLLCSATVTAAVPADPAHDDCCDGQLSLQCQVADPPVTKFQVHDPTSGPLCQCLAAYDVHGPKHSPVLQHMKQLWLA